MAGADQLYPTARINHLLSIVKLAGHSSTSYSARNIGCDGICELDYLVDFKDDIVWRPGWCAVAEASESCAMESEDAYVQADDTILTAPVSMRFGAGGTTSSSIDGFRASGESLLTKTKKLGSLNSR
jgi:hypothetical protein